MFIEVSLNPCANGDVETPEDAAEIIRRSGADAVMVGRGAQGRPWHIGWLAGASAPGREEMAVIVVEHYEAMLELYGREAGLRHARKHLGWYLDRFAPNLPADQKGAIMISKDATDVSKRMSSALLDGAFDESARKAA